MRSSTRLQRSVGWRCLRCQATRLKLRLLLDQRSRDPAIPPRTGRGGAARPGAAHAIAPRLSHWRWGRDAGATHQPSERNLRQCRAAVAGDHVQRCQYAPAAIIQVLVSRALAANALVEILLGTVFACEESRCKRVVGDDAQPVPPGQALRGAPSNSILIEDSGGGPRDVADGKRQISSLG